MTGCGTRRKPDARCGRCAKPGAGAAKGTASRTAGEAGGRAGRTAVWLIAVLLAVPLLAACAAPPAQVASDEPRGGIGGTGITTGVLGTVTGFGSIHANGVRIETQGRTAASPLGPVALSEGHVVEVLAGTGPGLDAGGEAGPEAGPEAGGDPVARRLAVVWPLVGPVTAAGSDGVLEVMGVPVRPVEGAILPPGGRDALAVGDRLAVSGLWRGGTVVASRLDRVPAGRDHVAGVLSRTADGPAAGTVRLGGAVLAGPLPPALASAPAGGFWQAAGRWTDAGVAVARAEAGRPLLAAGTLRQVSVEGYLAPADGGGWAVEGLGVAFDAAARVDPLAPGRAVFLGSLDRRFRVAHGIPLPEAHDARVRALTAIGNGLAPTGDVLETR